MSIPMVDKREQTIDVKGSGVKFQDMNLKSILVQSLRSINFVEATPIQEQAIPVILSGVDVVARAKNGTGKTGAFSIPMLQRLDFQRPVIQAIILDHARELAMQTSMNIKQMGNMLNIEDKVMCSVGGVPYQDDIDRLKKNPFIVVGTPSRILDFQRKGLMKLEHVKMLIMDEADKLIITETFKDDVVEIQKACSKDVQTLLFSATFPAEVETFCNNHLEKPAMINCMQSNLMLEGVTQYIACVREEKFKVKLLNMLFSKLMMHQCIIFMNNYRKCEPLCYMIQNELKIPCLFVHSKMELEERSKIFHDFSQQMARVLVTTDLYTRGIDIRTVNVVINFDVPIGADDYLHRIGRCGRFGHRGLAITLMAGENEKDRFLAIDNVIKASKQKQILNLPQDLNEIPKSLYTYSANDLVMK